MRTIIAGSRQITNEDLVFETIEEALKDGFNITEIVSGTAEGVDTIGEKWANRNDIEVSEFPYENYLDENSGKVAPLVRNEKMAEYADQAIIVWDGSSSGTENMIEQAEKKELDLYINRVNNTTIDDFTVK